MTTLDNGEMKINLTTNCSVVREIHPTEHLQIHPVCDMLTGVTLQNGIKCIHGVLQTAGSPLC